MENNFNIHDVKTVIERNTAEQANDLLKDGWRLLAVGFESEDDKFYKTYILGNVNEQEALLVDDDPLNSPFT